ncbi:MAG: endonuclease/exonuclease/phosphatase family protein [Bacteroidales bacterium]|nr:endonuclease/exonuclease/phosphatase family protein [Bacteroidales bacterium]
MRTQHLTITLFLLLITFIGYSQEKVKRDKSKYLRIAFYNVENLFDTIDDPLTNDADFLPDARIPWTGERYEVKLDRISEVIEALSAAIPAGIIGLCEVENRSVLKDLVCSPRILRFNYQIVHYESPDERGIDNALLYDPMQFTPFYSTALPVTFLFEPDDKTRDILYIKGIHPKHKKDTLHLYVNHWPSRYGGAEASEPKRIRAAEALRSHVDSLMAIQPEALVLIMGDFNDVPADKSMIETLQALALAENPANDTLYNLMFPAYERGEGTIFWRDWDMFDQIILNGRFWNKKKGIVYRDKEAGIFAEDWLMFETEEGILRPNRTLAREYYGGYSDHLPVYIDLIIKK